MFQDLNILPVLQLADKKKPFSQPAPIQQFHCPLPTRRLQSKRDPPLLLFFDHVQQWCPVHIPQKIPRQTTICLCYLTVAFAAKTVLQWFGLLKRLWCTVMQCNVPKLRKVSRAVENRGFLSLVMGHASHRIHMLKTCFSGAELYTSSSKKQGHILSFVLDFLVRISTWVSTWLILTGQSSSGGTCPA